GCLRYRPQLPRLPYVKSLRQSPLLISWGYFIDGSTDIITLKAPSILCRVVIVAGCFTLFYNHVPSPKCHLMLNQPHFPNVTYFSIPAFKEPPRPRAECSLNPALSRHYPHVYQKVPIGEIFNIFFCTHGHDNEDSVGHAITPSNIHHCLLNSQQLLVGRVSSLYPATYPYIQPQYNGLAPEKLNEIAQKFTEVIVYQ
ncbi:hypothetical protein GOODEAATRI_016773, partial [Goodea atripinnis]